MLDVRIPVEPVPSLTSNEVHLWLADLNVSNSRLGALAACLSEDEMARAGRFHFRRDRERFICARGLLRELLGAYTGRPPECFQFHYGPAGKPAVQAPAAIAPSFNISHSGSLALFAFIRGRDVGVDIEQIEADDCFLEIGVQYYSAAERVRLKSLEPPARFSEFFLYWTRREAYLKATGDGLSQLSGVLELHEGVNRPALGGGTKEWTIETVNVENGFAASIAVEGSGWSLTCLRALEPSYANNA